LEGKTTDFSACPAARGSTFSMFVKLNQTYENIVFDHRAGDCRVFQLLSVTEGDNRDDDHGYDDPCKVDDREEDFDCEEDFDVGFDRSVAICLAEEEHEEGCG
jgi:hypothetical protein